MPGLHGARIEDIVVVGESAGRLMNTAPTELIVVGAGPVG